MSRAMRDERMECPQCKKRMHPGFLLERGHHNQLGFTSWVEGTPEKSFWKGLTLKGRQVLPVTTYRCDSCGHLASYARSADA
jgi:Domain of unknown function (DUF6487)